MSKERIEEVARKIAAAIDYPVDSWAGKIDALLTALPEFHRSTYQRKASWCGATPRS